MRKTYRTIALVFIFICICVNAQAHDGAHTKTKCDKPTHDDIAKDPHMAESQLKAYQRCVTEGQGVKDEWHKDKLQDRAGNTGVKGKVKKPETDSSMHQGAMNSFTAFPGLGDAYLNPQVGDNPDQPMEHMPKTGVATSGAYNDYMPKAERSNKLLAPANEADPGMQLDITGGETMEYTDKGATCHD